MLKKGWKFYLVMTCLIAFVLLVIVPSKDVNAKTKIAISKTSITVYVGGDYTKLSISGTTKKVSWKSENSAIAKVSSAGKVYGIKEGKTVVVATVNSVKLKCNITVKNRISASTTEVETYSEKCIFIKIKKPIATDEVKFVEGNDKITCYWDPLFDTNDDGIITVDDNITVDDLEIIPLYISLNSLGETYIDVYLNGKSQRIRINVNVIADPNEEVVEKYTTEEKLAAYGIRMLYELLREPDSLEINEISYITNLQGNSVVLINYSAKNGYGGINRKNISLMINSDINNLLGYSLDTMIGYIDLCRNSTPKQDVSRTILDITSVINCIQEECSEEFIYYSPTSLEVSLFHEDDALENEMIDY
jgi:hypothetical protein